MRAGAVVFVASLGILALAVIGWYVVLDWLLM